MKALHEMVGVTMDDFPIRKSFLKWQCRIRQIIMREHEGRPDDAIIPAVFLYDSTWPMGHIITVLNKQVAFSKVPELKHIYLATHDPQDRRKKALTLFSETYYQKATDFSDILTSTFSAHSQGAQSLMDASGCKLDFSAYGQHYLIDCHVEKLKPSDYHYQATIAHNALFNSNLDPDIQVLGFYPKWETCLADPMPLGGKIQAISDRTE